MPISELLPRRQFLIAAAGFTALPGIATAVTRREAEVYVDNLVRDVLDIVNSNASEATILRKFEVVFKRYGDLNIIARSSLGVAWRSASASQRTEFINAFSHYVSIKYGRQFASYKGASITRKSSRDAGKKGILVKSIVKTRGWEPFEIEWQLSDRSGSLKIYNLIIQGISMLSAEREEIGNMLEQRRGNIDRLTRDLQSYG